MSLAGITPNQFPHTDIKVAVKRGIGESDERIQNALIGEGPDGVTRFGTERQLNLSQRFIVAKPNPRSMDVGITVPTFASEDHHITRDEDTSTFSPSC
jgi:hypothetical protein